MNTSSLYAWRRYYSDASSGAHGNGNGACASLHQPSESGSSICADSMRSESLGSIDAARREKAEARQRAKDMERTRIAAENAEYERRKEATKSNAIVRLSNDVEAKRQAKAAEKVAEKVAQQAKLSAQNAEMKKRIGSAGAAVDHAPLFGTDQMEPGRSRNQSPANVSFVQPEWVE